MKVQPIFSPQDSDLSRFSWIISGTTKYPKRTAWNKNPPPRSRTFYAHRIVMARKCGRELIRGEMTDHINGILLDCRRENLRITDNAGNQENLRPKALRGVTFHRQAKKWMAQVQRKGVKAHLGLFSTPEEAAAVAAARRKELNFLEGQAQ